MYEMLFARCMSMFETKLKILDEFTYTILVMEVLSIL